MAKRENTILVQKESDIEDLKKTVYDLQS